jgi:predicted dehydrogenase
VPDTVNALLMYAEGLTANLTCTFNNAEGAASGLEILGTEGSLVLRGNTLSFTRETAREDNRWVVASWAEAAEKAYYDDPKIQAVESPWLAKASVEGGNESWTAEGRDDTFTHIANFLSSVKTRTQPVEDAAFGHRAAACAHFVNQSIKEKRVVDFQA